ncbi:hypothetical protein AAYQ05_10800 [Flavobacterium sp. B11]|uniref:hypothetical protein n=1 Tax=Flavobacterium movens TaxID=214860 RepID=UPI0031E054F6
MEKDFIYGMKGSLENESGIVIRDKEDQSFFCGLIRWDTPKENDIEDWRGQFGTFIRVRGIILDSDYEFKYITEEGLSK